MAQKRNPAFMMGYRLYVLAFFIFLAAPLVAAGTFAFNDSLFPALPWQGFTLDWFFIDTEPKLGMFHDRRLLRGLLSSPRWCRCCRSLSERATRSSLCG